MDIVFGLVSIFLLVSMCGFGLAEHDIRVIDVEVPWEEANQGCEDIGYDILNLAVVSNTTLVSQGLTKEGEYYWTSKYKSRSPFYWKLGCYGVTDRSSLNETDFGNENSVHQCSQKCGDVQYIGLEDTTCFCFPASAKLSKESKTPCSTICPGNANEICGESGSGKMSVYRKLDPSEDRLTLEATTGDCVTLNKEDIDALYESYSYDEHQLFTDRICTEKKTFFCRNYMYDPTKLDSEIFIYKPELKTYYEAQRSCMSIGNDLAYIDGSNAQGVLSRDMIPVGSESWVGLFRATVELSLTKDNVTSHPVSCSAVSVNGVVPVEMYQPCMSKLKTLCMKGRYVTTTPTSGTSQRFTPIYVCVVVSLAVAFLETPTTEAPTTEAPTTELPITEQPTTEPPTTEVPTTEVPTTEAPTTEQPTTEVPTTEAPTTEVPITEQPTTEVTTTEAPTTYVSTAGLAGSEEFYHSTSTTTSTTITTTTPTAAVTKASVSTTTSVKETYELLEPNAANVAEKKIGEGEEDGGNIKQTGLWVILIALAVVFIIAIILMAMAYKRYRRNRSYQHVSLMMVNSFPKTTNGTVATETQTPPSPAKTPTPKKPARTTSMKQDNVLLNISQGNFVSQSDQFVPGTRDDVSWNLPFIDASRETLDNLDETQPVITRRTIILSENEANNLNIGQPNASVDLDGKVSQSHSEQETDALESDPMLNTDGGDDDIFDDNMDCRLPRSPSEHIDMLFRMSLSGEPE